MSWLIWPWCHWTNGSDDRVGWSIYHLMVLMLLYNKVRRTRKWSWLKKDNSVIVFFLPPLNSSRLPSDYAYFSLISNDHLLFKYWLLPRSKWSTTWGSLASTYGVSSPCFAGHLQKNDIRDAGSTADFADFSDFAVLLWFLIFLIFLILQKFVLKRSVLLNYTVAMLNWFSIHHIYGQICSGAISGMGWVWDGNLWVGLMYEHRFAVLIIE